MPLPWSRRRRQPPSPEVVELIRTASVGEAEVIAALLREQGIQAHAGDMRVDMALTRSLSGGRVFVRRDDRARAQAVLDQSRQDG